MCKFLSSFFFKSIVKVQVVQPYNSTDTIELGIVPELFYLREIELTYGQLQFMLYTVDTTVNVIYLPTHTHTHTHTHTYMLWWHIPHSFSVMWSDHIFRDHDIIPVCASASRPTALIFCALTRACIVQQRQIEAERPPSIGWASCIIDTFVTIV